MKKYACELGDPHLRGRRRGAPPPAPPRAARTPLAWAPPPGGRRSPPAASACSPAPASAWCRAGRSTSPPRASSETPRRGLRHAAASAPWAPAPRTCARASESDANVAAATLTKRAQQRLGETHVPKVHRAPESCPTEQTTTTLVEQIRGYHAGGRVERITQVGSGRRQVAGRRVVPGDNKRLGHMLRTRRGGYNKGCWVGILHTRRGGYNKGC
eukprot:1182546-Prorocentrum_minimum.AAC.3